MSKILDNLNRVKLRRNCWKAILHARNPNLLKFEGNRRLHSQIVVFGIHAPLRRAGNRNRKPSAKRNCLIAALLASSRPFRRPTSSTECAPLGYVMASSGAPANILHGNRQLALGQETESVSGAAVRVSSQASNCTDKFDSLVGNAAEFSSSEAQEGLVPAWRLASAAAPIGNSWLSRADPARRVAAAKRSGGRLTR